jgi:putative membrane protein
MACSQNRSVLTLMTQVTSTFFPALNAFLNFVSFVFLIAGFVSIKTKKTEAHRLFMSLAFLVSSAFLISYLYYHFNFDPVRLAAEGWIRYAYFTMLISHIILAVVIVPLILRALYLAYKKQFEAHRRIARILFPMWVYTSVTGVLIYFCLYVWFPSQTIQSPPPQTRSGEKL